MGRALRDQPGGIVGLLKLPREQWEAIEADLVDRGFTLADIPRRLSWRALSTWVSHAPTRTATVRIAHPEREGWESEDYWFAAIVDSLAALRFMWARKGARRPEPIQRPGHKPNQRVFRGAPLPIDEMQEWLGW